jgi:hypothetical protein
MLRLLVVSVTCLGRAGMTHLTTIELLVHVNFFTAVHLMQVLLEPC